MNTPQIGNDTIQWLMSHKNTIETDSGLEFTGKMHPHYYRMARKWFRDNGAAFDDNERSCTLNRHDGSFSLRYLEAIKKIEFRYCAKADDSISLPVAVPSPLPVEVHTPVVEIEPNLNIGMLGLAHVMQQNLQAILKKIRASDSATNQRNSYLLLETDSANKRIGV